MSGEDNSTPPRQRPRGKAFPLRVLIGFLAGGAACAGSAAWLNRSENIHYGVAAALLFAATPFASAVGGTIALFLGTRPKERRE